VNSRARANSDAMVTQTGVASVAGSLESWLATLAASLLPVSLIWDYSWESTVGVDRIWSPPHLTTHIGVWLCALLGLKDLIVSTRIRSLEATAIGTFRAAAGAWLLLWGVVAFETAFVFDNWWQQAYGLGAGIWHPPQILKAVSFVALQSGVIMFCICKPRGNNARPQLCLIWNVGMLLALIGIMMGTATLANAQHAASFYKLSCACFPVVLMLGAIAMGAGWGATGGALAYLLVTAGMVWILPLFPARPLTGPVHNPLDHLMPPMFPLLLIVPAVAFDLAARRFAAISGWKKDSALALIAGGSFVVLVVPIQWWFSKFLLSPAADNWFFAGGGRHWPFFLKIDDARVKFWRVSQDPLDLSAVLICLALAAISAFVGVRAGKWLRDLRR
jgi:hypothetical protein